MEHHYVESLWLPDTDNRTLHIPPKRITAYHESGHAVACYKLFHRLECVTIVATSEHRGFMQAVEEDWQDLPPSCTPEKQRAHIAKLATVVMAGGAAVARLQGTMRGVEMKDDLTALHELLDSVAETREEEDLFTDRVWQQAQRLVKDEWDAIKAVANLLIEKRTLRGKDVGGIVARSSV